MVYVDITRLLGRCIKKRFPTGIDRVNIAYLDHYAGKARAVIRVGPYPFMLGRGMSARFFELLARPCEKSIDMLRAIPAGAVSAMAPANDYKNCAIFNIGHSGLDSKGYMSRLRGRGMRPVVMIHDLIPIMYPEFCRPGEKQKHLARIENTVRMASGIIANSQETLDHLAANAKKMGLRLPPNIVAHLAPDPLPLDERRPIAKRYFLMIGTIEPRKNHLMVLQVWRELVNKLGESAPLLVIIGQRGWECENVVDHLDRCEHLRPYILEMRNCSDSEKARYLRHCQALLLPSFYEGFGIPLVEALSLNVPVIASSLPAFREIAGSVPEYASPLDAMTWMRLIEAYNDEGSALRSDQLKRLKGYVPYSWQSHFELVDEFVGDLVGSHA